LQQLLCWAELSWAELLQKNYYKLLMKIFLEHKNL
jgi:hypothetical protein